MSTETSVLKKFVRGESEWQVLLSLGASIDLDAGGLSLIERADAPVYEPSAQDVAAGLLVHWAVGTSLRDWARLVLAVGMVDLASLEDHPAGEVLLNALWDAAGGCDVSEAAIDKARETTAAA
jgi:hypothetical protein